jgi:outer membrane protein OmpA-like peptidoglycan-associated protein
MKTTILTLTVLLFAATCFAQEVRLYPLPSNTAQDEFAPAITNHGRTIFFTREVRGKGQRITSKQRSSDGWTSDDLVRGDVNDAAHSGSAALTPDAQTMIFAAYDHDEKSLGRTDLYTARLVGGKWKNVTNLGPAVNSNAYDSQPTLSADGRTLYFVSDRSGGQGGTDIYVSTFDGSQWSKATPLLGVNTASDEMSPSIAADGTTLYFGSNRPGGKGGFDIYVGKVGTSGVRDVKGMAAPINTAADELFYTSVPNSDQAFVSRLNSSNDWDNFGVVPNPFPSDPVTLVEGTVRNKVTGTPVGANITITDLTTGKRVASMYSDDATGEYFVTLNAGRVYSVTASAPGFLFHSDRYEVPPGAKGSTVKQDIMLSPIADGSDRLLVFFDFDKTELKSESFAELERVIEFLRDNPKVNISFDGHTDGQGTDEYNNQLSQRRADAVRAYVTAAGVDAKRVAAKGYGKRNPVADNATDEGRARNRRVEMRILQ